MDKKLVKSQISKLTEGIFSVHCITEINHNPHPYMVGTKHVVHASKHFGGVLDKRTFSIVGCAHPHCSMDYVSHTFDTILTLKLLKNLSNDEAKSVLKTVIPLLEEHKIDGIIFIETEENFRII